MNIIHAMQKHMTSGPFVFMALLLCLSISCHKHPNAPAAAGIHATIYEHSGGRVAAGAVIQVFSAGSLENRPTAVYITDELGGYSIEDLKTGTYNIRAEKDSFVLFQDSVIVALTQTTLRDDTLECASSFSGIVGLKPDHDPRTVSIRLIGAGRTLDVSDINGSFTFSGLAGGNYSLLLESTIPDYIPTVKAVTVAACSPTTAVDTLRLRSTGVPIVSGTRISQDTAIGTMRISWYETVHRDILDYLLYREDCEAKDFVHEPFQATSDTAIVDSLYVSLPADLADTMERCVRYWIAVRTNGQEIGTAYRYTEWRFAPKSYIMTSLAYHAISGQRECDSASINDTMTLYVSAVNKTRPLRSISWIDPNTNDTISRTIVNDRLHREVTDSIRHSFRSIGTHSLVVRAVDYAGLGWNQTVHVHIVPDIPVATAGPDTGVFIGEKVHLHGEAHQEFGRFVMWRWKIGLTDWVRTSKPDTIIDAPSDERTTICRFEATDEDGNSDVDVMNVFTSYKVKSVAAGSYHSLILKTDGTLWSCGGNYNGQLGLVSTARGSLLTLPQRVTDNVQVIAAGGRHSLILKTDGTLWACGENDSGQLGDGTNTNRTTPVKVMDDVQSMAAGDRHSLILKTDNTLWACGENDSGQLGDGTRTDRWTPVKVMDNVQSMAGGGRHSLILKTDNTLWACGKNHSGQLGNETEIDTTVPIRVMSEVKGIAAGDRHSLFLKTGGTLLASGNNWYGQLGDDLGGRKLLPAVAMTNIQMAAAGIGFSLALTVDNILWAFGRDNHGQLGIDSVADTMSTPTRVMGDVQSMSAGDMHTLILKTDGSVWGCGYNNDGQLGDGTTFDKSKPVVIIPPQREF